MIIELFESFCGTLRLEAMHFHKIYANFGERTDVSLLQSSSSFISNSGSRCFRFTGYFSKELLASNSNTAFIAGKGLK